MGKWTADLPALLRERNSAIGCLALMGIALVALSLITALALGWNDPGPRRPVDWTDPTLPRVLEAAPDSSDLALLYRPGGDFTWEVVAQPVAAPESGLYGYGLVYRAQDPSRYYAFAIGGDGYYAVLRVEGDEETSLVPWQQFPHIRRGLELNRLRVTCAGALCDFAINDERAATVEEEMWLSGDVGLVVLGYDEPISVEFASVRLWQSGDGGRE